MIVNIRGTSGCGKSTIVREIMKLYNGKISEFGSIGGKSRKQPLGYTLVHEGHRPLWVAGHYETACGGCDTLPTLECVYEQVRHYAEHDEHDVLYEGVIVTSDVRRVIELNDEKWPIFVVGLDVPIEDCMAGIQARRTARGDTRICPDKNTIAKMKTNVNGMRKLADAGVPTAFVGREEGLRLVKEKLGWF